jgi:hypothetical protein
LEERILLGFSFNGKPKAEANSGDDACGLPLNEAYFCVAE